MPDRLIDDWRRYRLPLRNRCFWAVAIYRFGRRSMRVRFLPLRWLLGKIYGGANLLAEILTGVHMDRNVEIGDGFMLLHPGVIHIHTRAIIGNEVTISHNVTIGTVASGGTPIIGDNVFISTGAVIVGDVRVGEGSRIGPNTVVMKDVPPNSFALGVPARIMPNLGVTRRYDDDEVSRSAGRKPDPIPRRDPGP